MANESALFLPSSASEEKYQVNVQIPSSGYHIRVPEGEILTVCVVRSTTTARLVVTVKGDTDPTKNSAIGKNCLFINLLYVLLPLHRWDRLLPY